jgi:hypothetical protein
MRDQDDRLSAREASFSLLRLSAAARLGGALVLIAALWAAAFWALH